MDRYPGEWYAQVSEHQRQQEAKITELRSLLEECQWDHDVYDDVYCRICGNDQAEGHKPDCRIALALAK